MKISRFNEKRVLPDWLDLIVFISGAITAVIGGLILFLWFAGVFDQTYPGQRFIPMADETAFLFVLLGISLSLFSRNSNRHKISTLIAFSSSITLVVSILAIVDFGTDYIWSLSDLLRRGDVMIGAIHTGRISFQAAVCFALSAVAQLLLPGKRKQLSVIFSSITLFTGYIVVLGYFYGVPLLYGGKTIPMALPTAILFVITSIGLLLGAGKDSLPVRYFIGDSVRARMLRILIPVIFFLAQIQGFILSIYSGEFGSSFAVINGVSNVGVLIISGAIIFIISRSIGTSIDNNLADMKRAEEALQKSEEEFRTLSESMPQIVWVTDNDGSNIYINQQWVEYTGLSLEESSGTGWLVSLHPEEQEKMRIGWADAKKKREIYSSECRIRRFDGIYRWWLVRGVPFIDKTGRIGKWYGTFTDIENLKVVERDLKESENKLKTLFELLPIGVSVLDVNHNTIYSNPALQRIVGLSEEEVYNFKYSHRTYINKEGMELPLSELPSARAKNEHRPVYDVEVGVIKENGEILWTNISAVPVHFFDWNIIVVTADITSRKREEKKVSQLAALVESSSDFIISQTLDGIITSWNKGAEKIYGYSAPEMIGKPISILTPPVYEDQNYLFLEKVKSGIDIEHLETLHQRKDGVPIHVSISISPIKDSEGRMFAASSIGHEITLRKKMEEELRLKTEQLIKLNAEKDKYFSIIAHDLRSPFSGFLGLTEVMAKDLPRMSEDEIKEISVILHRSANNLYNLLGNLLEWSYMQRGFTSFVPSQFFLQPKLEECLVLAIEAANTKEIQISFNIPDGMLVYADSTMFDSIMRNITNNAVKFTPRGGKINISAISVSDDVNEISIQDNGIGMSDQLINNLFLIDVNTARKGTEGEASTGLGLIICKDFIEKQNGKLRVVSEEGKGSTFRFTIPSKG